jgi:hypothetical protein
MPAPANPVAQQHKRRISFKKESTFGAAAGASGAQVVRRTQLNLNLTKQPIESGEKRTDFQRADVRHGSKMVDGSLDGELICGVWEELWAAVLRRDFATITPTTFSSGDGVTISSGVVTRAAGGSQSFITDGVRVGHVVRFANLSAAGNNARNFLVTAATATTLTLAVIDGGAAIADIGVADETCTMTIIGQTSFIPSTGHTSDSFNFEDYKADTDVAKLYLGCRIVGASLRLQPNGMVTISWKIMGIDREIRETSQAPYFTTPTEAGVETVLEASLGHVRLYGAAVAVITGMNIDIDLGGANTPVVGSNVSPDIFYGRAATVKGQVTCYVTNAVYLNAFDQETEGEIFAMANKPGNAPRDFVSIFMPRVKLMSASEDDPDTAIVQTLDFEALKKATATGYEATTIMIQDSTLS